MDKKNHPEDAINTKKNDETAGQEKGASAEDHKKKKKKDDQTDELQKAIAEKDEEIKKLKEAFLYHQADFENFKRLKEKEKQDAFLYGNEKLLQEILPVVDNLERALDHVDQSQDVKSIQEGVQLTLNELMKIFDRNGVKVVESLGKPFDPNFHEAYLQQETDDSEPGTVVAEFQKGYILNGRLVRPSRVSVAKKPESKE